MAKPGNCLGAEFFFFQRVCHDHGRLTLSRLCIWMGPMLLRHAFSDKVSKRHLERHGTDSGGRKMLKPLCLGASHRFPVMVGWSLETFLQGISRVSTAVVGRTLQETPEFSILMLATKINTFSPVPRTIS